MKFIASILMLAMLCVLALAEPRLQPEARAAVAAPHSRRAVAGVPAKHPYLFLSVPRGRASNSIVEGYELVEEDDDDNDDNVEQDDDNDAGFVKISRRNNGDLNIFIDDDQTDELLGKRVVDDVENNDDDDDDDDEASDDDDDDEEVANEPVVAVRRTPQQLQKLVKQAKATNMMVAREHAGAIMVPDGIIELEGQSIVDENTGKAALLVPRAALDAIPDGSVVALMERSVNGAGSVGDEEEEARANRVVVRRRRKGGRRRRRGGKRGNRNRRRRRRGGNRRRRVNKRRNVRVINNRRRGGRRGAGAVVRPIVVQG